MKYSLKTEEDVEFLRIHIQKYYKNIIIKTLVGGEYRITNNDNDICSYSYCKYYPKLYVSDLQFFDYLYRYFNVSKIEIYFGNIINQMHFLKLKDYVIDVVTIYDYNGEIFLYNINMYVKSLIVYECAIVELPLYIKSFSRCDTFEHYKYYSTPYLSRLYIIHLIYIEPEYDNDYGVIREYNINSDYKINYKKYHIRNYK